ncbi:aldehyde dehydrogenase family protein [Phycicoccus sp. Soil802]|uniref:aldehyde dehydrogenase family protein n=1 Tax=Phycicoccus sp. Soil802 TaxID=1736414 RepID=UPI000702BB94|nr:aldehyde dehydrogenase family protein [Phycicoccus sp. Soil802]KRF22328.1 aldehyde dehydrogenase [Phycicoccus sp. Soil802]
MHASDQRVHAHECASGAPPVSAPVPDLSVPGGALVNGSWQRHDLTLPVTDPEDGRVIGYVADSTPADVAAAVSGVLESVSTDDWPLWARSESLHKAARLLHEESARFAHLIASEGVKTIAEAEREVGRGVETLRLSAEAGAFLKGETIPFAASRRGGNRVGWFTREPVGVVAALTSFNDPLNLVAHKLGPALIAGNGVVLKPSDHTPLTALAFVELLLSAGVPSKRIAVVCGRAQAGQSLVADARIALVSFTGGPATAARITAAAGPRKMLMELGGNNPTIVCADAALAHAVDAVVDGAFGVAGQNCLSVQRVYVDASIYHEFLSETIAATSRLRVGSKRDAGTDIGPLVSEAEAQRVEEWVGKAVGDGATVHAGGSRRGAFHEPTILTDVPEGAQVLTDEIFGPVVTIVPFEDIASAIAAANSSDYALQAGVFTQSIETAFSVSSQLLAGAVIVNGTSDLRVDAMPFGGFKSSGIGREGVQFAVEAMTEPKNTIINLVS